MKKLTQRDTNPFPNSDSNKRYYTYDYYLRKAFGCKVCKVPLDGGFTCPNIDGRCGVGGCIYCSGRGSGDFAASRELSIAEQFEVSREMMHKKWQGAACIAYFQAFTNTYAPLSVLKEKYEEALARPGVVGLSIATRADCLAEDVVEYLRELDARTHLTVELGLQSIHDETAKVINRGHTYEDFLRGYEMLRGLRVCIHLIDGLPGEDKTMMLESAREVARLRPHSVKLHLLHIIEGTEAHKMYLRGDLPCLSEDEFVDIVVSQLELFPPDIVMGRLTGDGAEATLVAPLWSKKKLNVLNKIDLELVKRGTFQGFLCK